LLGVSHAPPQARGEVQALLNVRFPSICAYSVCRRTSKFDAVTHVVDERVSLRTVAPVIPRDQRSSASQCLGVLLCLYLHTLTQNDQTWHGDTWGGACFRGQPRHCICTSASRGLSARAECLISSLVGHQSVCVGVCV